MVTNTRAPIRSHRLRPLNLPRSIGVELNKDDLPVTIVFAGKRRQVEEIGEIWRIDDEWWRDQIARRYMEVMLVGGGHVMVYEDLIGGGWFMQ